MKTQLSPLNCLSYYVTDLVVTANPKHEPGKPVDLSIQDLLVTCKAERVPAKTKDRSWRVSLAVAQNVGPEKNSPYNFAITLMGQFMVHPQYPEDKVEQLVNVNGASVLFSSARQILRTTMANGPYRPLLLPTMSFVADVEYPAGQGGTPAHVAEGKPGDSKVNPGCQV